MGRNSNIENQIGILKSYTLFKKAITNLNWNTSWYKKELLYNGEGSLLYPGRDAGYDGVVASLRLKALRDGIEDYELLAILERAGEAAAAEKIVQPLAESWFQWEKSPAAYETARAELAKLILALPGRK